MRVEKSDASSAGGRLAVPKPSSVKEKNYLEIVNTLISKVRVIEREREREREREKIFEIYWHMTK